MGLLLEVWVGIGVKAFLVLDLLGKLVVSDHVEGEKVDDCLLPCYWLVWVDEPDSIHSVILYLTHCTSMRHEPLPGNIRRWIDLQEDQIPFTLCENLLKSIIFFEPFI